MNPAPSPPPPPPPSSSSSSSPMCSQSNKRKLLDELTLPSEQQQAICASASSSKSSDAASNNNISIREAQLIAQRKPMSASQFMCTCLVNALRDGGIIISYHSVEDDTTPAIEPPPPPPPPSSPKPDNNNRMISTNYTCNTIASILQQVNAAAEAKTNNGCKSPKRSRTNLYEQEESIILTTNNAPLSPQPPLMETAQRSFSLADRLLQVLERNQQSRTNNASNNGSSTPPLVGGPTVVSNNNDISSSSNNSSASSSPAASSNSDGSNDFFVPVELDNELRPDPAAAELGPADHTTITPLHWASNLGHDDCVRYLLMAGWNVNLRDMCGYTPLHYAVRSGSVSAVRLLLRAGAKPDSCNDLAMTPLHGAILDGALAAAKLLLMSGGNVDCRDINGQTALMFAAQSGRSPADAVEMLLDFNADANLSDMNGETALSCCYRLHRARPNSAAIKSKLDVLLRASRPEAIRPLRWYATREVDPEFAQLSHSVTRLERLAALRVRQMFGHCYLPDILEKYELPSLIKDLLLLKR